MKNILVIGDHWIETLINMNQGKLISKLISKDLNVSFYCKTSDGDKNFIANFPNATLLNYRYTGSLKYFGLVKFFTSSVRMLIFHKPDLVLWSYVEYVDNIFFALLGIPYILKTDSNQMSKPNTFTGMLRYRTYEYVIKKASLVLVETPEVEKRLKEVVDRDYYHFPNGVPIKLFTQYEAKFKKKTSNSITPYILFTGRIMHEKGIDLLLESFSRISSRNPEWKLYIVGPIIEREYMETLEEFVLNNNLSNNVFFLPFKTGVELYELYYFAEIFVLPSRHEGLANRITEAMFFQNPIVAFDVNQTKSLVTKETGELVPAFDVFDFSNKIEFLINNEEIRKNKGKQARFVIESKFNDDELFPNLFKKVGLH